MRRQGLQDVFKYLGKGILALDVSVRKLNDKVRCFFSGLSLIRSLDQINIALFFLVSRPVRLLVRRGTIPDLLADGALKCSILL